MPGRQLGNMLFSGLRVHVEGGKSINQKAMHQEKCPQLSFVESTRQAEKALSGSSLPSRGLGLI